MNGLLCFVTVLNSLVLCLSLGGGLQGVLGVLLDESNQALQRAVTVVVNELTSASLLELQRREPGDLEVNGRWEVVLSSLHLGAV